MSFYIIYAVWMEVIEGINKPFADSFSLFPDDFATESRNHTEAPESVCRAEPYTVLHCALLCLTALLSCAEASILCEHIQSRLVRSSYCVGFCPVILM